MSKNVSLNGNWVTVAEYKQMLEEKKKVEVPKPEVKVEVPAKEVVEKVVKKVVKKKKAAKKKKK